MIHLPVLKNSKSLVQCTPSTFSSENMSDFNLEYGIPNQFILNELETLAIHMMFSFSSTMYSAGCKMPGL